jgi:hypothetical protein
LLRAVLSDQVFEFSQVLVGLGCEGDGTVVASPSLKVNDDARAERRVPTPRSRPMQPLR